MSMRGQITVDASVFVGAFIPGDKNHPLCLRFFQLLKSTATPLVEPSLVIVEVAASLRRITGDETRAMSFAQELASSSVVTLVSLSKEFAGYAAKIAAETGLRGADAVYAATAARYGSTLVSLDKEQLDKVPDDIIALTPSKAVSLLGKNNEK